MNYFLGKHTKLPTQKEKKSGTGKAIMSATVDYTRGLEGSWELRKIVRDVARQPRSDMSGQISVESTDAISPIGLDSVLPVTEKKASRKANILHGIKAKKSNPIREKPTLRKASTNHRKPNSKKGLCLGIKDYRQYLVELAEKNSIRLHLRGNTARKYAIGGLCIRLRGTNGS